MDLYKLLISTQNPHKLREIRAIMNKSDLELVSLDAIHDAPEVVEDRDTLDGNASKKAEELFQFAGLPTMSDDTGLEVDALGGAPGVRSARFAGENATAAVNRALLLVQVVVRALDAQLLLPLALELKLRFIEFAFEMLKLLLLHLLLQLLHLSPRAGSCRRSSLCHCSGSAAGGALLVSPTPSLNQSGRR